MEQELDLLMREAKSQALRVQELEGQEAALQQELELQQRQFGPDEVEAIEEGLADEQRAGLHQVDGPGEEVALVGGVDAAHHRAGLEDAKVGDAPLGPILGKQHDLVAHRDAQAAQGLRDAV